MYTLKQRPVPTQRRTATKRINAMQKSPLANISKDDNGYQIFLAIPGLKKDQLDISVKDNLLTISQKESECAEQNFTRKEFDFTAFSRSFTIPDDIDVDHINASVENGILQLALPIKPEEKPRSITIK